MKLRYEFADTRKGMVGVLEPPHGVSGSHLNHEGTVLNSIGK